MTIIDYFASKKKLLKENSSLRDENYFLQNKICGSQEEMHFLRKELHSENRSKTNWMDKVRKANEEIANLKRLYTDETRKTVVLANLLEKREGDKNV